MEVWLGTEICVPDWELGELRLIPKQDPCACNKPLIGSWFVPHLSGDWVLCFEVGNLMLGFEIRMRRQGWEILVRLVFGCRPTGLYTVRSSLL